MKHRTRELSGALLDAAVAMADGLKPSVQPYRVTGDFGITFVRHEPVCVADNGHFEPSTDWRLGGPIIDRERITVVEMSPVDEQGEAHAAFYAFDYFPGRMYFDEYPQGAKASGPTYLTAAMRAYVASKLGDEVELP